MAGHRTDATAYFAGSVAEKVFKASHRSYQQPSYEKELQIVALF